MRVSFDSNAWEKIFHSTDCKCAPIRGALKARRLEGFISEAPTAPIGIAQTTSNSPTLTCSLMGAARGRCRLARSMTVIPVCPFHRPVSYKAH